MNYQKPLIQHEQIEQAILLIRGQRVMLDRDLAALYKVTTGNLNKAVQRNSDRFPADFMFQLTDEETAALLFQSGRSKQRGGSRFNPYVFTQEPVTQLTTAQFLGALLKSPRDVGAVLLRKQ